MSPSPSTHKPLFIPRTARLAGIDRAWMQLRDVEPGTAHQHKPPPEAFWPLGPIGHYLPHDPLSSSLTLRTKPKFLSLSCAQQFDTVAEISGSHLLSQHLIRVFFQRQLPFASWEPTLIPTNISQHYIQPPSIIFKEAWSPVLRPPLPH